MRSCNISGDRTTIRDRNSMPRRFSMIRSFQLADWITVANAFCGMGALFSAMEFLRSMSARWHLLLACGLIPLAPTATTEVALPND